MEYRVVVEAPARDYEGFVEEEYRIDALIAACEYVKRVTSAYKRYRTVKVSIYRVKDDVLEFNFRT